MVNVRIINVEYKIPNEESSQVLAIVQLRDKNTVTIDITSHISVIYRIKKITEEIVKRFIVELKCGKFTVSIYNKNSSILIY